MRIGVLFGGRSYEHDISIITATEVCAALKGQGEILPIYAREGEFYLLKEMPELSDFAKGKVRKRKVRFCRVEGGGGIVKRGKKRIDCMVMCCHGGEGEDGRFSALMEVYDIPYTASSVLPSALSMDKRLSKVIFEREGFFTPLAVFGRRGEDVIKKAKALVYPLIVKPVHLGSSIGIGVAHEESELIEAVSVAYAFDEEILVEEVIENAVELNCAAYSDGDHIVVGAVENPTSWHEYLTFEDKYKGGKYKSGGGSRIVEGLLADRVKEETEKVYRAFGLFGIARIDFLYSETQDVLYVNEINSQPGSLAFYLFEENGISFPDLLRAVIHQGIERQRSKGIINFNSGVLENLSDLTRK